MSIAFQFGVRLKHHALRKLNVVLRRKIIGSAKNDVDFNVMRILAIRGSLLLPFLSNIWTLLENNIKEEDCVKMYQMR